MQTASNTDFPTKLGPTLLIWHRTLKQLEGPGTAYGKVWFLFAAQTLNGTEFAPLGKGGKGP
jgi:hypothetical protein